MRHFLFEEKEYTFKPGFKRLKKERDSAQALASLLRRGAGRRERYGDRGGWNRGRNTGRADLRQKCITKTQYSFSRAAHSVQLEKYLARDGTGRNGGSTKLYGSVPLDEYRANMVDKNYRVFISPQSADKIDLKVLTEKFVDKLEKQLGYQLYWQAANHYNTAHPHAHLLINGVSKDGRPVDIPRDVVKTFMRETARDLCTLQAGLRTERDLEIERENELAAPRWTRIDDRLLSLSSGSRLIVDDAPDRDRLKARLDRLSALKLCKYEGGGYTFRSGWDSDLRANSKYNAFLTARESLAYSAPQTLSVYTGEKGAVSGKVTKIFRLDDDASDNHAVIVEGLNGKAYFVPLLKKPEAVDKEAKGGKVPLREGDFITLRTYKTQKGRLTPVMMKRDMRGVLWEIKKESHAGRLAQAVLAAQPSRGEVVKKNKEIRK